MSRVKGEQPETKVKKGFENQELGSGFSDTDGQEIDLSSLDHPDCVKVVVGASSDITASDDVQFTLEEKASGGSYSDTADSVSIGSAGIVVKELDIEDNKQLIRFYADKSNSSLGQSTDFHVDLIFSGMDSIPQ